MKEFMTIESPKSTTLEEAILRCGIEHEIAPDHSDQIDRYCQLLWKWNEKINLTRHTDYDLFVRRDLLDSLQLAKLLKPSDEVLDIGTGGGVPGVLLAILRPDVQVTLSDSIGKKAKVVDDIVHQLKLEVPVFGIAAQKLLDDYSYDTLVARAVGPLSKFCIWFKDHWHQFDRLLAIKGPRWIEERSEARHRGLMHGLELRKVAAYVLPETGSQSVILQLRRPRPGEAVETDEATEL